MPNPQWEDGFIKIANEIADEILLRNFTKLQRSILDLIIRLSWGCNRRSALIPFKRDFEVCGVDESVVEKELQRLIRANVITRFKGGKEYGIQKDYSRWQIAEVSCRHIMDPRDRLINLIGGSIVEPEDLKGKQTGMFNAKKQQPIEKSKVEKPHKITSNSLRLSEGSPSISKDILKTPDDGFEFLDWIQKELVSFFNVSDPRYVKQVENVVRSFGGSAAVIEEAKNVINQYKNKEGGQPHFAYVLSALVQIAGRNAAKSQHTFTREEIEVDDLNPLKGKKKQ